MAVGQSLREQAIEAIEEYLEAARICIETTKPSGGGILGYPATLLLLCATDAIGHGVLPAARRDTRLDVLADPLFGYVLTFNQAEQVTKWYRHLLAHNATMARGVSLEPDTQGLPFEFDNADAPVCIRVGKLREIVSYAWTQVNKTTFNPPVGRGVQPDPTTLPPGRSLSSAASGVLRLLDD